MPKFLAAFDMTCMICMYDVRTSHLCSRHLDADVTGCALPLVFALALG